MAFQMHAGAQSSPSAREAATQRYVTLMLLNLSNDGAEELKLIHMAHAYGMNSVYLTIPWDRVYHSSPTDSPKWQQYDEQIQLITSLGMSVAIRIHVARNKSQLNGFWDWEKDGMKDHAKISQMGAFQSTTFRYNYEPAVAKAAGFVTEVVNRYKWVHEQHKLVFVSVTNTPEQEAGFPYENFEPDTNTPKIYPAIYECSDQTMTEFRAWLQDHYKKIERLNLVWGTNFESFETAGPHLTFWEPTATFRLRYGKDWYLFRHEQIKKYTETMIRAVKKVDSQIRYVSDYGSVFDEVSSLRGTTLFGDLNKMADGIKINDAPESDNRFTMDVVRGGFPRGAFMANEVFGRSDLPLVDAETQLNENFAHGADMVTFVISLTREMTRFQPVIRNAVANWQSRPKSELIEKESLYYSQLMAVEKSILGLIYSHWRNMAYADPGNPQPVRVLPGDDFLVPSYWDVAANRPPYLKTPLPMQIIAVDREFRFDIPEATFDDLDGHVVRIQMDGLPGWMHFDGKTLTGKSGTLGDTRIRVTATDDEGSTFTAFLTVRIDTRENANKPPVMGIQLGTLAVRIHEPFSFSLPAGLFTDEDGSVTKIEALELPGWLHFKDGVFSGTPPELGDYRVILKAYDDLNAFVETFFELKVVEPQFLNASPEIRKPIPVQYGPEKELFSYTLDSDTFVDHDGYIASVVLQGQPTWMSINFNRISGTPPAEGEYRFFVRAYDNYGAWVDAPFILRVEKPFLNFTLQEGGRIADPNIVRQIAANDIFQLDSLPELLNIAVSGNYNFDRLVLRVSGPYEYETRTRRVPFTYYPVGSGFKPFIGRYTLSGEAYTWNDSLLFVSSIAFSIGKGADGDLTGDMPEWTAYPVPFRDVINLKTAPHEGPYQFTVVSSAGRREAIPAQFVTTIGSLSQLNVGKMGLRTGVYFIEAVREGEVRRRIKVVKY